MVIHRLTLLASRFFVEPVVAGEGVAMGVKTPVNLLEAHGSQLCRAASAA